MDLNEERFAAQIKAIVDAGETDTNFEERPLTLAELKELAISMGLNEEQWEAMLVKAEKHLKLADDHLKARNFKDAIAEGEQAVAINPYLSNCNAILAKAYMMLWIEDQNPDNKDKAAYYAKKELVVDPKDQQAVMVLSTINKKTTVLEKDQASRKKMMYIVGGVVLVILLILFFFVSSANKKNDEHIKDQTEAEYNAIRDQLIEAEEDVNLKLNLVQVAIDQRNSMIPDLFAAVKTSPYELTLIDSTIKALQAQIQNASGEEKFKLESSVDAQIEMAKDLVNSYADAGAVEKLMIQIEGSENRIAFEKKNYNSAVKAYNVLVKKNAKQFPEFELKPYYNEQ